MNIWSGNTIEKIFLIKQRCSQVYGSSSNIVLYNEVQKVLQRLYPMDDELTLKLSSIVIGLNSTHQKPYYDK